MKLKRSMILATLAIAMFLAVTNASTVQTGVTEAIKLNLSVIIPSLFPLLFLSGILNNTISSINRPVLKNLCGSIGIPPENISILFLAVVGGYPVGAKNVCDTYRRGGIDKPTAERLLGFCNNAGPSFIFGMLSGIFQQKLILITIWGIQILSALSTGFILPKTSYITEKAQNSEKRSISQILFDSIKSMASICGWVIIFRVLYAFMDKWFSALLQSGFGVFLIGILELSNGCLLLPQVDSLRLRFLLCNLFLSFGGFCVWMQTASVTSGLSNKTFYIGKCFQFIITATLSALISLLIF